MRTPHRLALATVVAASLGAGLVQPASAATTDPAAGRMRPAVTHAMDTEAFAYAQYNAFADAAGTDTTAAHTWRTVADVEYWDHFVAEGKAAGLVGTNTQDLQRAIAAEAVAVADYAAGARVARAEGCPAVAATFDEIRRDEQTHHDLFVAALRGLWHRTPAPAAPALQAERIEVTAAACPRPGTTKALAAAMQSEATSWASYQQWAQKAANTGHPDLAALFRGIGLVELKDHYATEANLSGMVGSVRANLATSAASEVEANAMYTADIARARRLRNRPLASLLTEIRSDERGHLASFRTLLAR